MLTEILDLFPSRYMHLGGDECSKERWAACGACAARMAAEGLDGDCDRLQSWFVARVAQFVQARGRTVVGWDEVLEGGIPEGACSIQI